MGSTPQIEDDSKRKTISGQGETKIPSASGHPGTDKPLPEVTKHRP